jgi:hypothetical protein
MSITSAFNLEKDTSLKPNDTRITNRVMARPKQFSDRTTLAFPPGTFAAVANLTLPGEDKSDFIRAAVELEVAIRKLGIYEELRQHLTTNETVRDFCARAVKRAVLQRKAALAEPDPGAPILAEPDPAAE